MRKLVTVQRIASLTPIEGADNIEKALVLGWSLVVIKGQFKENDLCCYYEIDSLLPIQPEYRFMTKDGIKKMVLDGKDISGYRLRTKKMRQQISQGLAMPISILNGKLRQAEIKEGLEVTDLLGVVKYETPISACLSGVVKGAYPADVPKTDEERVQAFPQLLTRYKDKPIFYVSEKCDGTSCSIIYKNGELDVCSRNLNLLEDSNNTLWQTVNALNLKEKLQKLGRNIALQGELVGEHIQDNRLKIKGHKILFFNIYNIDEGEYLDYPEFRWLCKALELQTVPIITDSFTLPQTIDELVTVATRKSLISPDLLAEGIVIRPMAEVKDEDLGRLSFKCISPTYLLKFGE